MSDPRKRYSAAITEGPDRAGARASGAPAAEQELQHETWRQFFLPTPTIQIHVCKTWVDAELVAGEAILHPWWSKARLPRFFDIILIFYLL